MSGYFQDSNFQNRLIAHLVSDRDFLRATGKLLQPEDFRPTDLQSAEGWARWITAQLALNYWERYRQPVGGLLSSEVEEYCQTNKAGDKRKELLLAYAKKIEKLGLEGGRVLAEKTLRFKKDQRKTRALEEMFQLHKDGQLTDDKMIEICRSTASVLSEAREITVSDFFLPEELQKRIERRKKEMQREIPLLMIDPLDRRIRAIGRGELGLILAPYKRGKSMALIHLAIGYVVQGLNVVFVTLEDPKHYVEDRMDAAVAELPMRRLGDLPNTLASRTALFRRFLQTRLKVVDATEGQCSVEWLDKLLHDQKDEGFLTDVLIVDYDDEIKPPMRYKADPGKRRMEFADIYRGLRQLSAKEQLILWTAAQTQRGTEETKIISGDKAAEDISKVRKVNLALGIGYSDQVPDGRGFFVYVAAHKTDRQKFGVHIVHKKECGVFYDREATRKWEKQNRRK